MKIRYLAIIAISFSMIIGIIVLHAAYAQNSNLPYSMGSNSSAFENSVGLTSGQCQDKILYEKEKTADSLDRARAVELALSSPDFQSKVSGHRYALALISTKETWNASLCGNVKITAVGVGFNLLDTPGNYKSIQVVEDANVSQVIKVNTTSNPICSIHCTHGKPTWKDFTPDLQFGSFFTGKAMPNSTIPIEFDLVNNGNYTLYNAVIVFFDSPLLSMTHSSFENFTLKPGEQKTTAGTIRTPSELPNVPILLNYLIGAKDQDGRMGSKEFQQIINLANMSSYERSPVVIHAAPPLKQFKSGIKAQDVKCKDNLVLAIKKENGLPACINPDGLAKLVIRGWAENPLSHLLDAGYSTQEQQDKFFYDIMNLSPLRQWSESGWRFIGGNHIEYGNSIHFSQLQFYLPPNSGNPKLSCNEGWHADVAIDTRKLVVINATYPLESDCGNQTAYVYRESGLQPKGPNESVPNTIPNTTKVIHVQNSNFTVSYDISGGKLDSVEFNKTRASLVILLTANDNGDLTVTIPRALLDSRLNDQPYQFLVLVDDYPVRYVQTTSISDNTLTIPFSMESAKIEITID